MKVSFKQIWELVEIEERLSSGFDTRYDVVKELCGEVWKDDN